MRQPGTPRKTQEKQIHRVARDDKAGKVKSQARTASESCPPYKTKKRQIQEPVYGSATTEARGKTLGRDEEAEGEGKFARWYGGGGDADFHGFESFVEVKFGRGAKENLGLLGGIERVDEEVAVGSRAMA